LSVDAIEALNGIYDEAMSICTISANYYKSNPVKKELFTFSKIVAHMGTNRKDDDKPTE
jgi:hypothetical protein